MRLPTSTTYAVGLALAGCVTAALAGCGATESAERADPAASNASSADDRLDGERMGEVARDASASADDVVDAGRAVDAAVSGDGEGETVLVTYTVDQGTSEGRSAGAWRLYDADGDPIATEAAGVTEEGAATPDVIGLPDGYLLQEVDGPVWHVAPDGSRAEVARADGPQPARAGDVPLDDGTARLYRPGDRTLVETTPAPARDRQGWAVTDDGTPWQQLPGRAGRIPFERSATDGAWEPAASYRPRPGQVVNSSSLTAVGDRVAVLVTAESADLTRASLVGLLVRDADASPEEPWREVTAPDVPGTGWWDARLVALDDTTVALGLHGQAPYLVDVTSADGGWTRLPLPSDEEGWVVELDDGRAVATHPEHADAWVSDDRGADWHRLPH